jgi:tRNA modification GTPase
MNRLSGTRRAICAAVAGTTRDILTAPIQLGRCEAILLDSAGVDESEDQILAQARELALSEATHVDLVCLVLDATNSLAAEASRFIDRARSLDLPPTIVAANKIDLLSSDERVTMTRRMNELGLVGAVGVSAVTGEGIEALRAHFLDQVGTSETTADSEAVLLTTRQQSSMRDAAAALGRAAQLASAARETIDCADLLAFELREALDHIGAVTGAVTTEDLLSHVFANFCIGK